MQVTFAQSARREIEAIGDYIARHNPDAAIDHVLRLREKCLDLANFPNRFPLADGVIAPGVRKRVYGKYLIYYTVDGDNVHIVHVVHGARDPDEWQAEQ